MIPNEMANQVTCQKYLKVFRNLKKYLKHLTELSNTILAKTLH